MSLNNILVIDDHALHIEDMQRLLKLYFKHEITVAKSLEEVRQQVPQGKHDFYFLGDSLENSTDTWKEIADYIQNHHEDPQDEDARIVLNVKSMTDKNRYGSAETQREVKERGIEEIVYKNEEEIVSYLTTLWREERKKDARIN